MREAQGRSAGASAGAGERGGRPVRLSALMPTPVAVVLAAPMSAVAAVAAVPLGGAIAIGLLVVGVLVVLGLLVAMAALLREAAALRREAATLAAETVRSRAELVELRRLVEVELARVQVLTGSAEALSDAVGSVSRIATSAAVTPVIKAVAIGAGAARAGRRLRRRVPVVADVRSGADQAAVATSRR